MPIHDLNPQAQLLTGPLAGQYLYPIDYDSPYYPNALEVRPETSICFEYWPTLPERTALFIAASIVACREIGQGPLKYLPGCETLHTDLDVKDFWKLHTYELETGGSLRHILCVQEDSKAYRILNVLCAGKPALAPLP